MKTIDARGKTCPVPLIMTKKGVSESSADESLVVLLDNETSAGNVARFLQDHGMEVLEEREGGTITLTVPRGGQIPERIDPAVWCAPPASAGITEYMIAFKKNTLGLGNDDLGKLLIKGFINTLPDIDHKPHTLAFLNAGIFLTLRDSPVLEALKRLEETGVQILVCGTCLDFYLQKENLAIGVISNMYDILDAMTKAGKVLAP